MSKGSGLICITAIVLALLLIHACNRIDQNQINEEYRNFTVSVAKTVANWNKIHDINLSEEVNRGITNFCNVGKIVTEKFGVEGKLQKIYSDEKITGICKFNNIVGKIDRFQPMYNNLIDVATKIESNSSDRELYDFNSRLGEMNGKFIYFSNFRLVVWVLKVFNDTINVTEDQIDKGDERIFEIVGNASASITPRLIKEGITSKHVIIILINDTQTFLNITNSS